MSAVHLLRYREPSSLRLQPQTSLMGYTDASSIILLTHLQNNHVEPGKLNAGWHAGLLRSTDESRQLILPAALCPQHHGSQAGTIHTVPDTALECLTSLSQMSALPSNGHPEQPGFLPHGRKGPSLCRAIQKVSVEVSNSNTDAEEHERDTS